MIRDELTRQIEQGHIELEALLDQVPDDRAEEPIFPNGWSLKDFWGHIGFWEKRALGMFRYFKNESVLDPKPGALSLDEINAWAIAAYRDLSVEQVRVDERDACQALIRLVETAGEGELFDPQHFPLTEGKPFANWIEDNTFGHYQEHRPDINAALNLPGWIKYNAGEESVRAYVAHPKRGGPGVVVLHAWWGLNPFFQRLCDRLAEQGFVVIAPDLFQGNLADTVEGAMALQSSLEESSYAYMRMATASVVERLRQQPGIQPGPVGVIGTSFGAAWALELSAAQPEDVAAVVLFYGSYEVEFHHVQAAYQGHFAEIDEWEPVEGVRQMAEKMKAAGREIDINFYSGTGHWFFEDDRPDAFVPEAANLAWERTLSFLNSKIRD